MADEVLSQAEVESLLHALDAPAPAAQAAAAPVAPKPQAPTSPGATRLREKITSYDFKRPERVGKDQMRSLQTLHEGFGRNFGAALSALLRAIVEVKLTSVDQLTYSEFIFSLENPTCMNMLKADPLEGNLILDINPSILYPIIDRMLGGGKEPITPHRRPLTEIERRLVGRITHLFLEQLEQAWSNVLQLKCEVVRIETNPQLAQIVPPNEVVVLVSFELTLGDVRGMINLCIPYNSIERISSKLTSNSWAGYTRHQPTAETRELVGARLQRAQVDVAVEFEGSAIRTRDLINLRVGDVVTTSHEVHRPLTVTVAGVPKFQARVGALKGQKAIQVTDYILPDGQRAS